MTPRTSKLLEALEAAIKACRDLQEGDRLRAEYVTQLARYGRVEEAAALLADLRQRNERGVFPALTPWIKYADAILDRRLGQGDASLMKMRRAQAMSTVAGLKDLQALTAAWLAHIYWNREDPEAAAREVRQALGLAAPDAHDARCRASLVVAEILAMSRREDLAQPWFVRARNHAKTAGDDAAQSALAFNLAICRLMITRQRMLSESRLAEGLGIRVLHLEASENLDSLLAIPTDDLTPIQRARLFSMQNRPDLALEIYTSLLRNANVLSAARQRAEWLSDEAWCHARLGDLARAKEVAEAAEQQIVQQTQIDDRAAIHSRLALVYAALGEVGVAARHETLAADLWATYRAYQDRCVSLCESITVDG